MAVSLATINVNGMAERHKRVKVFELLRSFKHDLFFLQETHFADTLQCKAWEKEWGGRCVVPRLKSIGGCHCACSPKQRGETS